MSGRSESRCLPARSRRTPPDLGLLNTQELLDVRFKDLRLSIEGTWLEGPIQRVKDELVRKRLRLRPHFWLADEWFSPEGIPGVALPFYLAHPRLLRLERNQMLEVEGGTREECVKLLRHELGHAIQHGYRLHRRRRWQQLFGLASEPYPDCYRPNPASRNYVQHLDSWYAQSHPVEDFAETFAVWLAPRSNWRERYADWPGALRKLEYVDELMAQIENTPRHVSSRQRPYSLPTLKSTLRQHYEQKRATYSPGSSQAFDEDLLSLFSTASRHRSNESAASFLRRNRRDLRMTVGRWTGEYQFTLDQVLKQLISRCRELKLKVPGNERKLRHDFAILLTVHTMKTLHRRREWQLL